MDVISDHSRATGEQPPAPQFDHRIRWGNVALALAALVAIVAAVGFPRAGAGQSIEQSVAPVTDLVTEAAPALPTTVVSEPRRKRTRKKPQEPRPRKQKPAEPARPTRSVPVTPAPTPKPVPASPAPAQTPAAEREFGL
ncbi:MAG: hypothetical protein ACRDKE_05250 [Solirubrobacterales bacterium]